MMHSTLANAEDSAWDHFGQGLQYTSLILGILLALFGLYKAVQGWRKARDEAVIARSEQMKKIDSIESQFRENGGSSLLDRQVRIETKVDTQADGIASVEKSLAEHIDHASDFFIKNDAQHEEIHRRLDGVFEILGGQTDSRKAKTRHKNRCDREEQ